MKDKRIFIAGHAGMVGSAIVRKLRQENYTNILTIDRAYLDLTNSAAVKKFFDRWKPEIVILAAGKVGGIQANLDYPGEFIYQNLMIQCNVINESLAHDVEKFVFLGSSCIYPRHCPQPMKPEHLLSSKLESSNEGYAIAKIAGIKMLEGYSRQYGFKSVSLMPCNLYGPNDNWDPNTSHVLSALVRKFVDAVANNVDEVTLWGTGAARREFMHVDDAAAAIVFMMERQYTEGLINIGTGSDISILGLATIIADRAGFCGKINWDHSKPDGMPVKVMDVSEMEMMGFTPRIELVDGIDEMISIYKAL